MIQLIKFFIIGIIFLSCNNFSDKKNLVSDSEVSAEINENKNFQGKKKIIPHNISPDFNGLWTCYKFSTDAKLSGNKDVSFAKEMSKYARLKIENNIIDFGTCKKELYSYKYPAKLKKYDDESIFITHFKPENDSVYFVSSINSGEDKACDLFENYTFYLPDSENIIQYFKGYFFYYKKFSNQKTTENLEISGIPGNNKSEWVVKWVTSRSGSLEEDYDTFKRMFPYGAKNLSQKIPDQSVFIDKINGIMYERKGATLQILKDDPLGKIYINIVKEEKNTKFQYEFRYPEY